MGLAGEGLGAGQGGVMAWCSRRCCWVWLVAALETAAQVEAAELAGTAPGQGVTVVGAAALKGTAGEAVTGKAATMEAAAVAELVVMVGVAPGQDAEREEVAASVEAVGQAAVGEVAAALVEAAVQGMAVALVEAVVVVETAA